ncbi:hypothetical protein LRB32_04855, partial [Borreliella americana]|nr:hypothetical protein [Borreliella americana]
IMKEIESSTKEYARLRKDLETIKQILDNIESLLNTANSYLENTRKAPKSIKIIKPYCLACTKLLLRLRLVMLLLSFVIMMHLIPVYA